MSLGPFAFLVAVLAAYRLARLVAVDSLVEGWRDTLRCWAYELELEPDAPNPLAWPPDSLGATGPCTGAYRPVFRGPDDHYSHVLTLARGKLADLVTCPFCAGVWASAGVYAALAVAVGRDTALVVHVASVLAVAGGQCLLAGLDEKLR